MLRKRDAFLFSIIAIKIFWKNPIVTEKNNANWQSHNALSSLLFFSLDQSSSLSGPKFLMGIYSSLAPDTFWSFSFHRKSLSTPPLPRSPLRKEEDLTFSMLLLHMASGPWEHPSLSGWAVLTHRRFSNRVKQLTLATESSDLGTVCHVVWTSYHPKTLLKGEMITVTVKIEYERRDFRISSVWELHPDCIFITD